MSMSFATTGRFLKGAAAATAVTLSLGAATLASVEPAQAYGGYYGYHHRYVGGFHHYGYGYRPLHRFGYGFRPYPIIRAPFYGYGYGYHRHFHGGFRPYAFHHRYVY